MSTGNLSSIVERLESATSNLKEVQTKLHELHAATEAMRNFHDEVREAIGRSDLTWLMQLDKHFSELSKRVQTAGAELAVLLQ